jgi:hypothetical protein
MQYYSLRYLRNIWPVGEATLGENDYQYGSRGQHAANDEEPGLGRHRDEVVRIDVNGRVKVGVK